MVLHSARDREAVGTYHADSHTLFVSDFLAISFSQVNFSHNVFLLPRGHLANLVTLDAIVQVPTESILQMI